MDISFFSVHIRFWGWLTICIIWNLVYSGPLKRRYKIYPILFWVSQKIQIIVCIVRLVFRVYLRKSFNVMKIGFRRFNNWLYYNLVITVLSHAWLVFLLICAYVCFLCDLICFYMLLFDFYVLLFCVLCSLICFLCVLISFLCVLISFLCVLISFLCVLICFLCVLTCFLCALTCFLMIIFDLSVLACFHKFYVRLYICYSRFKEHSCSSCYFLIYVSTLNKIYFTLSRI